MGYNKSHVGYNVLLRALCLEKGIALTRTYTLTHTTRVLHPSFGFPSLCRTRSRLASSVHYCIDHQSTTRCEKKKKNYYQQLII